MKAQELRIGNLVLDDYSGEMIVFGIVTGGINPRAELRKSEMLPAGSYHIDTLKPIPLTPEWLERFGFNRCDNITVSDSFYWIRIGASEFAINPDNGIVWITTPRGELFNNPALITHVHQLQNLYFALTGQELEIKS